MRLHRVPQVAPGLVRRGVPAVVVRHGADPERGAAGGDAARGGGAPRVRAGAGGICEGAVGRGGAEGQGLRGEGERWDEGEVWGHEGEEAEEVGIGEG